MEFAVLLIFFGRIIKQVVSARGFRSIDKGAEGIARTVNDSSRCFCHLGKDFKDILGLLPHCEAEGILGFAVDKKEIEIDEGVGKSLLDPIHFVPSGPAVELE